MTCQKRRSVWKRSLFLADVEGISRDAQVLARTIREYHDVLGVNLSEVEVQRERG
jgi:hypothetical protein